MKIGFAQFCPLLGEPQANLTNVDRLVREGPEADLLVLPELANSGYNFVSKEQAWETSEEVANSVFVESLAELCRKQQMHLVCGVNERDGDKLFNSSVLVGPEGVVGKYRKMHLFMNEKDIFQPGDSGLPVFDIGLARVGMAICFDWFFPEVWRILALDGADVICHPSNLIIPGLCQRAIPIHALTNHVYIVTANRIGTEDDLTFTGLSTIADPKGELLAQAGADEELVTVVDVDIATARDKTATARNDLFADRRPEEYRRLLNT
ncbi:MAG: carbon-nitrogen hydrolase [candidate division Zixibacteria bacterium]|nr:carbon-nitrogen hydrolase [candidate division Zixibacteria bacterium]MDH3935893.1 carbon-nitrogen hydrolase [candidate division Zixibacteria bacterium]MDH4032697.1 carbon-nitrogen hydrolase [candidate division Zixibacteria bacterium]